MIYAATGQLAFGADSVPAVMHRIMYDEPDVSGLPPSLRTVVLECLDKDPARRPSARDLLLRLVDPSAPHTPAGPPADDLADSVPHTGPVYPPAGPTFPGHVPTQLSVPGQAPARSRRTPILVAAGAVAAAIAVLAVVLLTQGSPPASPAAREQLAGGQRQQPRGRGTRRLSQGDRHHHHHVLLLLMPCFLTALTALAS